MGFTVLPSNWLGFPVKIFPSSNSVKKTIIVLGGFRWIWTNLLVLNVGNEWVAGGCWDYD